MAKKQLILGIITVILFVGGMSTFILWRQKQKPIISSSTQSQIQPADEVAVWEDQAGFSFQYPKTLSFDKHEEDMENYAHIEFTSASHSGRLIVWAKDTTYPDVTSWVTKDKDLQGATSVDTTLGGEPAKKIIIFSPSKKIIVGTISDQILFTSEAEPMADDPYWTVVSDTIASSFVFTPLDTSTTNTTASEDAGSYVDEEEVVE